MQQQWQNVCKVTNVLVNSLQMWIMATLGIGRVCMYSSLSEKQDQLLFSTTRFMPSLVLFRHLHSFSLSSLPVSVELHQEVHHYSTAVSLRGAIMNFQIGIIYSFSMQVSVGHRCAATTISEKLDSYHPVFVCFVSLLYWHLHLVSLSSLQFL